MPVPITNFTNSHICNELDIPTNSSIEQMFTSTNVIDQGLDRSYCGGIADLRTQPYEIGKWRNYTKITTVEALYGHLYNSYVVVNSLGKTVAPIDPDLSPEDNWKVPTKQNLEYLIAQCGNDANKLKSLNILQGTAPYTNHPGWLSPNIGAQNAFSFNGTAAGMRTSSYPSKLANGANNNYVGEYESIGKSLILLSQEVTTYTSSGNTYQAVWVLDLRHASNHSMYKTPRNWGYSIRCCRNYIPAYDGSPPYKPIMDASYNWYNVIRIGNMMWMASNLRTVYFNDGSVIPLRESTASWNAFYLDPGYCTNLYET